MALARVITPGGIVPSSGDFIASGDAEASAMFLATGNQSADRIVNGGLFFSFQTVVQHVGTGSLWFDYADASQVNPTIYFSSSDEEHPLVCHPAIGSVLEFTVVPEPSGLILLFVAGASCAAVVLIRRVFARRYDLR